MASKIITPATFNVNGTLYAMLPNGTLAPVPADPQPEIITVNGRAYVADGDTLIPFDAKPAPAPAKAPAKRNGRANGKAPANTPTLSDACWQARDSQKGKAPSAQMLWAAYNCGALTLPKATPDAYTLGLAIAKRKGMRIETA